MIGMDKETRKAKAAAKKAQKEAKNIGSVVSDNVKQNLQNQINNTKASFSDAETLGKPANNLNADTNNKVEAQSVTQAITPNNTVEQPKPAQTFSDMLAPFREKAKQEKTDAVKMQKYYALADALKSLGHMGGAAIGGAIGGNVLDSAPKVGEYQQSRGYIDAFEKAKKANDRLRDLDDYEFKLNLSKQQRDEERAYNEKVRAEERKYRAELMRLESELRQAEKAGDREAEEKFRLMVLELTQAHEEKLKRMSVDMVNTQMAGKTKDVEEDTIPFTFQNLTKIDIPKNLYPEMLNWALTLGQVGEDTIDEDNVETILRKNPELVNSFLNLYGYGTKPETTSAESEVSDIPATSSNPSKGDIESVQNISIMHDSPTLARIMDSRNQKIAQKQAVKNNRVQELMDAGYTEQEAKRQVRVEKRIAKAAGKFGFNGTDGAGVTRVNEPVIVTDEDGIEWE